MKKRLISVILIPIFLLASACSSKKSGDTIIRPDDPIKNFVDTVKENATTTLANGLPQIYEAASWIIGVSEEDIISSGYFEKHETFSNVYQITGLLLFNRKDTSITLDMLLIKDLTNVAITFYDETPNLDEEVQIIKKYRETSDESILEINGEKVGNFYTFIEKLTADSTYTVYLPSVLNYIQNHIPYLTVKPIKELVPMAADHLIYMYTQYLTLSKLII